MSSKLRNDIYRFGIDIGGTFTDAILLNEETGLSFTGKVPTTPDDPSQGFMNSVRRLLSESGISPSDIAYLVHATTIATNAIIEGKIARTGFITTSGFRDMLEIGRQIRPTLYDLQFIKPPPLVPRYLSFDIPERMDSRGHVVLSLDEESVRSAARSLKNRGVESVAVCFLHSYINSAHERRAGEIIIEEYPEAIVSLSSDIAPEFREYFRASTTVINAATRPVVSNYLGNIESGLRTEGFKSELLVMQSSGGVLTFKTAGEKPVFMVESGPAAGAVAAANLGNALGYRNVLSFDMGGTTAKACLIQNGTPEITKDYQVGAEAARTSGAFGGASGYPIRTPVIDLAEIGAGGGSIAWVDDGGVLRVGPESVGADPGPACYGNDGGLATITDANLVLGRLNPDNFLGGEISLDAGAAHRTIDLTCAQPLGMTVEAAAIGIIEIGNSAMVNALRLVSVQRGFDPRDFVLIAFGGAGPVHANRLSAESEVPTLLIPLSPGIFSATGLLVADLKHDFSVTMIRIAEELDPVAVERAFLKMRELGRDALARESTPPENMAFGRAADMRYHGQSFELTVPLPEEPLNGNTLRDVLTLFHLEHERAYGFTAPGESVEFVNLRMTVTGLIKKPALRKLDSRGEQVSEALDCTRKVYFQEAGGWTECPIYDRYRIPVDGVLEGPAVIEEKDSTTVIHPGFTCLVDDFGNLIVDKSS